MQNIFKEKKEEKKGAMGETGCESADIFTRNFKTIMEQEGIHHLLSGGHKVCTTSRNFHIFW